MIGGGCRSPLAFRTPYVAPSTLSVKASTAVIVKDESKQRYRTERTGQLRGLQHPYSHPFDNTRNTLLIKGDSQKTSDVKAARRHKQRDATMFGDQRSDPRIIRSLQCTSIITPASADGLRGRVFRASDLYRSKEGGSGAVEIGDSSAIHLGEHLAEGKSAGNAGWAEHWITRRKGLSAAVADPGSANRTPQNKQVMTGRYGPIL